MKKVMDWKTAQELGYRVSEPKRVSMKLENLCIRLGDEYHLARIDGGNVIHRVIVNGGGNSTGWDVEIFHVKSGSDKYNIALWKGYGRERVHTEEAVRDMDDTVACMVEMMLHLNTPASVYPTKYNLGPRPLK